MLTFIATVIGIIIFLFLILLASLIGVTVWLVFKIGVIVGLVCIILLAAREIYKYVTKK